MTLVARSLAHSSVLDSAKLHSVSCLLSLKVFFERTTTDWLTDTYIAIYYPELTRIYSSDPICLLTRHQGPVRMTSSFSSFFLSWTGWAGLGWERTKDETRPDPTRPDPFRPGQARLGSSSNFRRARQYSAKFRLNGCLWLTLRLKYATVPIPRPTERRDCSCSTKNERLRSWKYWRRASKNSIQVMRSIDHYCQMFALSWMNCN